MSNPKPSKYGWYFKKELIGKNPVLQIKNVQFNNSGSYTFIVENPWGMATATIDIDIKCK